MHMCVLQYIIMICLKSVCLNKFLLRIRILKGRKHYEEDWEENVYNIYLTVQYVLVWHVIIYQVLILSYYCISINNFNTVYMYHDDKQTSPIRQLHNPTFLSFLIECRIEEVLLCDCCVRYVYCC